jgi:hypothetical protein
VGIDRTNKEFLFYIQRQIEKENACDSSEKGFSISFRKSIIDELQQLRRLTQLKELLK